MTKTRSAETLDPRAFRETLGLFPTGVAIVTTCTPQGERIGATVSSFNSVSLDPPLVLFSIARNAKAYDAWANAEHYAVNILPESQSELSTRFARALSDKWEGIAPEAGAGGAPLLREALAWFECRHHGRYDGGDHLILVGEVIRHVAHGAAHARPLVFYKGRYRKLDPDTPAPTPSGIDHLLHGW
ncbi:flavin reductase family protein [Xanthobacteraceae bacterium A53D]